MAGKKGKKLTAFFSDADNVQRISFMIKLVLELFKIGVGCFLVVFVPQRCDDHTCTFKENITDLDNWNIFALVFNLFTFIVLLGHYAVDLLREYFLIASFDVDQGVGDNALAETLEKDERWGALRAKLWSWNRWLIVASVAVVLVFICNLSFSAATVLYFYYDGFRSATGLLTNTLLVTQRVIRVFSVSAKSFKEGSALSTALTEPMSYNVIDKDVLAKSGDNINIKV